MCKVADGIIFLLLVLSGLSDWKKRTIPVFLLVIMSLAVACFAVICGDVSWRLRLGGALMGIVFLLISKCTKEAIGYGDSWLIMVLGVQLGYLRAMYVLFAASLIAGIVSLFYLWKQRWKRNATLPFVPFLAVAYLGEMFL